MFSDIYHVLGTDQSHDSQNFRSPFLRLPQELYSKILELILLDTEDSHDLLPYTHVSRQWRYFAVNSPLLWTKYAIHNDPHIYPELLRWAGPDTPISVVLGINKVSSSTTEFISTFLPRLRSLNLLIDARIAPVILESIIVPAPSLQTLRIQYYVYFNDPEQVKATLAQVFRAGHPKLRSLELLGIPIDWDSFPSDNITELKLDVSVPYSALSKMPQLRVLRLVHWDPEDGDIANTTIVELQSLQELEVTGISLPNISSFLNHLRIPTTAQLTIDVQTDNSFGSESSTQTLPFCQPSKHLTIAWDTSPKVIFTRESVSLSVLASRFVRFGLILKPCLDGLAGTAALETLALRMNSTPSVTRLDWMGLLRPMIHLTRLDLLFEFSARSLLLILAEDFPLSMKSSTAPPLPSLSEMVLTVEEGSTRDFNPYHVLVRFLQGRIALGVGLSKVTVLIENANSFQITYEEKEEIGTLVDDLRWETHNSTEVDRV